MVYVCSGRNQLLNCRCVGTTGTLLCVLLRHSKKVTISSLPAVPLLSDEPRFAFLLTRNTFSASVPAKTLATNHARSLCSLSRSFCMCILQSSVQVSHSLTDLSTTLSPIVFRSCPPGLLALHVQSTTTSTGSRCWTQTLYCCPLPVHKGRFPVSVRLRRRRRSSLLSPLCLSPSTWKFTHGS